MNEIFIEFAKLSPLIGVLAYFIFYFKEELMLKNNEIKELNTLLRQQQKDTLETMVKLTGAIEDLRDLIKTHFQ